MRHITTILLSRHWNNFWHIIFHGRHHTTFYLWIYLLRINETSHQSVAELTNEFHHWRQTTNYTSTSVFGVYPHMPIPLLACAHASTMVCHAWAKKYRLANSSNSGLLGGKVYQKWRFPAQDADEPPCKIRRR